MGRLILSNPFDYVNSIYKGKPNMMRDSENDILAEKSYSAYLTNKALSYYPDTILHANMMNMNHHIDNRPQYEFLLNSVKPSGKNRYKKWVKEKPYDDVVLVCEAYNVNKEVAKRYLEIISPEQLEMIKKEQEKGGNK